MRLREGPLPVDELHALALAVAGALAYCHTPPYHLVHCDVKPANLLSVHGQWKLSDFGLARALGARAQIRGLALGTLTYAPPEALSGLIAPAWDVWSLGMLLLEAATGCHPLAGVADPAEVLRQPLALPALPAPFDAICAGCLRMDQRERWTAHQVLAALDAVPAPAPTASHPTEGLTQEAPPTLPPHHLPQSAARFIGRERECSELLRLLTEHRLITLTGVGGSGKTRLALEAARRMLSHYHDGAWFVDLAPLNDPAQLLVAVSHALHVPLDPARPALEVLTEYLADKRLLLIPDNCEHLVEACAAGGRMRCCAPARGSPAATSREVPRVGGAQLPRTGWRCRRRQRRTGHTSESISTYEAVPSSRPRPAAQPNSRVTRPRLPLGGGDLPAAGRPPAGAGAGRRPAARHCPARAWPTGSTSVPPAHRRLRAARCRASRPCMRSDRLELSTAQSRRTRGLPPAGGLRRRVYAGSR